MFILIFDCLNIMCYIFYIFCSCRIKLLWWFKIVIIAIMISIVTENRFMETDYEERKWVNNKVCKTDICKKFLSKNFNKAYYTSVFLCKEILYSCCHQIRGHQQNIPNPRDKTITRLCIKDWYGSIRKCQPDKHNFQTKIEMITLYRYPYSW